MSFSSDVKDELRTVIAPARHCRLAEMQAICRLQGGKPVERKFFTIREKAFNIDADQRDIRNAVETFTVGTSCCRRSYLRGAFLAVGSMSDPARSYHLEFVCRSEEQAEMIRKLMQDEQLHPGITRRGSRTVVYLKESGEIVELLGMMEAQRSLLAMENERVLRDVRGNVNRRVNLETANISKAVRTASRQIDAIRFLTEQGIEVDLPESLRKMAALRLKHPEATLEELGSLCSPPIGKSGVNHRLRRIVELAQQKGFK